MAKEIVIDIIDGKVDVSSDVQTGDTVAVIKAKNLPEEWLSDSTYVYALISQGENQVLNLMHNATENSKTVKKCGVQSVFTADNKAFKIVIFGTNVEVADGTVNGSYRYVSAPVMVSVGGGLESLTAEILPDKNGYEAISSFLISLQSAVEAEKVRAANEDKREEAEEARAGAEEIRASAEFERAEAEAERAKAESRRIESESIRADNEELRIGNEGQRIQNETARIEEESKRESSENAREEAEKKREEAEEKRNEMPLFVVDASKENIDNILIPGIYYLKNMKHSSYPYGLENVLIVTGTVSLYKQTLFSPGEPIKERFCTDADWSEWQIIVDNSMLESRLQRFADEFTIDVDQSYNANSENAQSGKAVAEAVAKIVNGSPEALDTLYELAKALGNDENFSATVMAEIGKKADKASLEEAESDIARILDGRASVGKATRDSRGNYIHTYYATKEELESKADKADFLKLPIIEKTFESINGNILTEPELNNCTEHKIYRLSDETGDIKGWLFCTNFSGGQECGQVLIDDKGEIYARHQRIIVDDEGITSYIWNDWEKYAKEKYVTSHIDAKIGDIETSLENIINKYGLGGEAV